MGKQPNGLGWIGVVNADIEVDGSTGVVEFHPWDTIIGEFTRLSFSLICSGVIPMKCSPLFARFACSTTFWNYRFFRNVGTRGGSSAPFLLVRTKNVTQAAKSGPLEWGTLV